MKLKTWILLGAVAAVGLWWWKKKKADQADDQRRADRIAREPIY